MEEEMERKRLEQEHVRALIEREQKELDQLKVQEKDDRERLARIEAERKQEVA